MKQIAFGKYTLHHRLTRGGMAELFIGRSVEPDGREQLVVIKLLLSHYSEDEAFISMFRDEVRLATTLRHPNIGRVLDVGEVGGQYYIAMDYIHGHDLCVSLQRSLRQGGPLPVSFAVPVAIRLCAALHYAHQARDEAGRPLEIVHRDVSLSNVMITFSGQVKLVDFGIAKAANRCSLTVPGMLKGKARYMSPEQITGQHLDHRSDLFTLGTTLWEATCGQHLFKSSTELLVYEAVAKGWVTRPSEVVPGYPPELERILLRALALSPADRHPTALALQQELLNFAAATGIQVTDLSLSRTMHQLYPEEVRAWQQAVAQRKTLLQHLTETAGADRHARDLGQVLTAGDQKRTRLAGHQHAAGATLSPEETDQAGSPPVIHERRKTLLYGQEPAAPAPALPALPTPGPQQAAAEVVRLGTLHYRLAEQGPLALGPDGKMLSEHALGSDDDRRPTIMDSSAPTPDELEARRPTLMDAVSQTLAPDKEPTLPPDDDRSRPPLPQPRVAHLAPQPLIAKDSPELAPQHASLASALDDSDEPRSYRAPSVTGDWAHQATSHNEKRAGTHPYFGVLREVAQTFRPVDPEQEYTPQLARRRLLIRLALLTILLSAVALATLLCAGSDKDPLTSPPDSRSAERSLAPPAPSPAVAVRLDSIPRGASVYAAESGQELGQTPIMVELQGLPLRQVILRLPDHRPQTVRLTPRPATRTVTLIAEGQAAKEAATEAAAGQAATEAAPTKKTSAPAKRPPRAGKPRFKPQRADDNLLNPFD